MTEQLQRERQEIRDGLIKEYGPIVAWMAEILREDGKWRVYIPGHGKFDVQPCNPVKQE